MQLITDYPWYFLLLCLIAGGGYSLLLYGFRFQVSGFRFRLQRRRATSSADGVPRWAGIAMPVLRFASVALLTFLLLGPLVKRRQHEKERPIVVVAEDASTSITAHGYAIDEAAWQPVIRRMEKDFEVVRIPFGDRSTNLSATLSDIHERYAGRNLAAVVLGSDGIYNEGQNPMAVAPTLAVPIYTVALGDTAQRRDAAITAVRYNRIAYLGNRFGIEVTVRATRLQGRHTSLTLRQGGKVMATQPIAYSDDNYTATVTLTVDATQAGLQSYTLTLAPLDDESNSHNNSRTLAVEVIDGHQKIALIAAAPHPDVSALRQAIEHNANYTLDFYLPHQLRGMTAAQLREYNLIILHNLPTSQLSPFGTQLSPVLEQMPTLYIVGTATDLSRFNALHSGVEIVSRSRKSDEVTATHNRAFTLFSLDEELCRRIEQLPPLQAPFGEYRTAANLHSLMDATVAGVATGRPMIAFCQQEGIRHAFIIGEGIWRWRLHGYEMTGSHADFNTLVEKMVVYTSLQVGKERFRVVAQPVYEAGDAVQMEAELYNDNYEPVNTPDAEITLRKRTSDSRSSYTFNRSGNGYLLRLGSLEEGTYQYTATTTFNGKAYTASGAFAVEATDLEELTLVADHALLYTLASTTGGAMLSADSLERLPQLLAQRDDIKSVIYSHTRYTDLMHLPWVLVALVLLLAAEWWLRKYYL